MTAGADTRLTGGACPTESAAAAAERRASLSEDSLRVRHPAAPEAADDEAGAGAPVLAAPPPPEAPEAPPAAPSGRPARRRFLAVTCTLYAAWSLSLAAGMAAYEGEPIAVRASQLPLRHFDVAFRRAGVLFAFALLGARALVARGLRRPGGCGPLVVPGALYAGHALMRSAVYQLHLAGYLFPPERWAARRPEHWHHPPHVMSDHILLAASAMAACACEAAVALKHHGQGPGGRGSGANAAVLELWLRRALALLASCLCVLISAECYFTARYFHPPSEILAGALVGLALFQMPLVWYGWAAARHCTPASGCRAPGTA